METIEIKSINDKEIIVKNYNELSKVFDLIIKDNNFVAHFGDNSAEVVIGSIISSKVKSGDLKIRSEK